MGDNEDGNGDDGADEENDTEADNETGETESTETDVENDTGGAENETTNETATETGNESGEENETTNETTNETDGATEESGTTGIRLIVENENGDPVARGVTITIEPVEESETGGITYTVASEEALEGGEYEQELVETGDYHITAEGDAFETVEEEVTVEDGEMTEVTLTLDGAPAEGEEAGNETESGEAEENETANETADNETANESEDGGNESTDAGNETGNESDGDEE